MIPMGSPSSRNDSGAVHPLNNTPALDIEQHFPRQQTVSG